MPMVDKQRLNMQRNYPQRISIYKKYKFKDAWKSHFVQWAGYGMESRGVWVWLLTVRDLHFPTQSPGRCVHGGFFPEATWPMRDATSHHVALMVTTRGDTRSLPTRLLSSVSTRSTSPYSEEGVFWQKSCTVTSWGRNRGWTMFCCYSLD
jgi:hypothetical protein